jgi:hypothetical protein
MGWKRRVKSSSQTRSPCTGGADDKRPLDGRPRHGLAESSDDRGCDGRGVTGRLDRLQIRCHAAPVDREVLGGRSSSWFRGGQSCLRERSAWPGSREFRQDVVPSTGLRLLAWLEVQVIHSSSGKAERAVVVHRRCAAHCHQQPADGDCSPQAAEASGQVTDRGVLLSIGTSRLAPVCR